MVFVQLATSYCVLLVLSKKKLESKYVPDSKFKTTQSFLVKKNLNLNMYQIANLKQLNHSEVYVKRLYSSLP